MTMVRHMLGQDAVGIARAALLIFAMRTASEAVRKLVEMGLSARKSGEA